MNFNKNLDSSKSSYSNEWEATSRIYHQQGLYDVLTNDYKNNLKILEVGSGAGYSTLSLIKKSKKLISIDENINCVRHTYNALLDSGIEITILERGSNLINPKTGSYKTEYKEISDPPGDDSICIEGNILNDFKLLSFLNEEKPFDVITCWMIGVHKLIFDEEHQRVKERSSKRRDIQMVQDYKWDVLKSVADLSIKLLSVNGILHIVERVNLDHISGHEYEMVGFYNSKIEESGLTQLNDFDLIEIDNHSKIPIVTSNGKFHNQQIGLLSLKYKIR